MHHGAADEEDLDRDIDPADLFLREPGWCRLHDAVLLDASSDDAGRKAAPAWYTFIVASATDTVLATIVGEAWEGMRQTVGELVGEINPERDDSELRGDADVICAAVDGLVLRVIVGALSPQDVRTAVDQMVALYSRTGG